MSQCRMARKARHARDLGLHWPLTHARHCCVTMSYMSQDMAMGRVPELTLGWRLRMALGGMSAGDMADWLGVNRATVSRWMNGHGAPPRRAFIAQWALLTGVDAGWLLTGERSEGNGPGRPPTAGFDPLPIKGKLCETPYTSVTPFRESIAA